jgi:hypothetical protein
MSDNLSEGSSIEESQMSEDAILDVMYDNGSEPQELTVTEDEQEVDEVEETDEEQEGDEEAAEEGQADEDPDSDEEVEVFDKPNEFVKYELDEETGLYEFKSNGKRVQANIEKLINSYQGNQKVGVELENLAKAKNGEFDQAKQQQLDQLKAQSEQLESNAVQLVELLKDGQKSEEDWEYLRDTDPSEFLKQRDLQQKRVNALQKVKADNATKQQERVNQYRTQENEKLLQVMGWEDAETLDKDIKVIHKEALEVGYTQEEAENIYDHRVLVSLFRAAKQREMKSKDFKGKEVKIPPKPVKSKRSKAPSKSKEVSDLDLWYNNS